MTSSRVVPSPAAEELSPRRMVIAEQTEMASVIVVDSIPPGCREEYLRWLGGINRAAEAFAGYRETSVFPPLRPDGQEWITIVHFQTRADLQRWLESDVRAGWVAEFRRDFGDFTLVPVQGGLSSWFAQQRIPGWKMVLTVLLALYPTVMVIAMAIMPRLSGLPFALTMLVGNVLSVSALQWMLMPRLNRILGSWLKPAALVERRTHIVGTLCVLAALLGLLGLFLAIGSQA